MRSQFKVYLDAVSIDKIGDILIAVYVNLINERFMTDSKVIVSI